MIDRKRKAQGYSGLGWSERIRARRRLKKGMELMLKNAPAIHYTQKQPPRWEGIVKKLRTYKGEWRVFSANDCARIVEDRVPAAEAPPGTDLRLPSIR